MFTDDDLKSKVEDFIKANNYVTNLEFFRLLKANGETIQREGRKRTIFTRLRMESLGLKPFNKKWTFGTEPAPREINHRKPRKLKMPNTQKIVKSLRYIEDLPPSPPVQEIPYGVNLENYSEEQKRIVLAEAQRVRF